MTISASKVRSLCSSSEIVLVRASRRPELEQLSHAQVKRLAVRARKQFDKWQGLGRGQSRNRRRRTGSSDLDASTRLKAQIFRDALESFEARLASLVASDAPAAKMSRRKTKKDRSSGHRASRAAIRKGMTAVEDLLNIRNQKNKLADVAAEKPLSKSAHETRKPAGGQPAARPLVKTAHPPNRRVESTKVSASKRRDATTAAKKSRVDRSGKSTRVLGHIGSRGKRAQARRDAKS